MSPSADERALPSRFVQPIISRKRGLPEEGTGYVGVDSRILMGERLPVTGGKSGRPSPAEAPEHPELHAPRARYTAEVVKRAIGVPDLLEAASLRRASAPRVAIIDVDCGGWGALGPAVDTASLELARGRGAWSFPRSKRPPERERALCGHGVLMAGAVRSVAPGARLGLFEAPCAQDCYAFPTDLAAALALAVGEWQADVVLVTLVHGVWGTPAHLRHTLRNAALHGRAGLGAVIVCSLGRLDLNRDVEGSSAVQGGDDFNAQPWVLPVAACTLEGRWLRAHGMPLSLLGPSAELCAPGDIVHLEGLGRADDSSLAAALVAGAAARMLRHNPTLTLAELRSVLRLTAEPGPVEDLNGKRGIEAESFTEWDRSGHNFKLGYGRVHVQAACLAAADPVCHALLAARHPAPPGGRTPLELQAAQAWEARVQALASHSEQAREYLELRGHLVPLLLQDLELRDALQWLARHLLALRRTGAPGWPRDGMDHGVLVDRSAHLLDTLSRMLGTRPPGDPWDRLRRWCSGLSSPLEDLDPQRLADFLGESLGFCRANE